MAVVVIRETGRKIWWRVWNIGMAGGVGGSGSMGWRCPQPGVLEKRGVGWYGRRGEQVGTGLPPNGVGCAVRGRQGPVLTKRP